MKVEHLFVVTANRKADGTIHFAFNDETQKMFTNISIRLASESLMFAEQRLGSIIKSKRSSHPYGLRYLFLVRAIDDGENITFKLVDKSQPHYQSQMKYHFWEPSSEYCYSIQDALKEKWDFRVKEYLKIAVELQDLLDEYNLAETREEVGSR